MLKCIKPQLHKAQQNAKKDLKNKQTNKNKTLYIQTAERSELQRKSCRQRGRKVLIYKPVQAKQQWSDVFKVREEKN